MIFPQPIIQNIGDGSPLYRIVADYRVDFEFKGKTYTTIIRAGTITDLASVPEKLRSVVDNNGAIDGPAAWHDDCWRNQGWSGGIQLNFFESAAVFYGLMRRARIGRWDAFKVWLGVTNPVAYLNWRKNF